jgi:hypothetical protein
MEIQKKQLSELRYLIQRYILSRTIQQKDLTAIYKFLFNCSTFPTFKDKKLISTIEYFKKVLDSEQLKTFEKFNIYFLEKFERMDSKINTCKKKDFKTEINQKLKSKFSKNEFCLTQGSFSIMTTFYSSERKFGYLNCTNDYFSKNDLINLLEEKLKEIRILHPKIERNNQTGETFTAIQSRYDYYKEFCLSEKNGELINLFYGRAIHKLHNHPSKSDIDIITIGRDLKTNDTKQFKMIASCKMVSKTMYGDGQNFIDLANHDVENFKRMMIKTMIYAKFYCVFKEFENHIKISSGVFISMAYDDILERTIKMIYEKTFSNKKWSILKSPQGCSWITSDNPGIGIRKIDGKKNCIKLELDTELTRWKLDTAIYFPLSKDYCLQLFPIWEDQDYNEETNIDVVKIVESSKKEYKVINRLTYNTSSQVAIANNKEALEECKEDN